MTDGRGALVLFSGGQDSATCVVWALERFDRVETLGFAYGQCHAVELQVRTAFLAHLAAEFPQWRSKLAEDHLLDLPVLGKISDTALTREVEISVSGGGLPNTFVPGRNLVFLTLAAALAYRRGLKHLVTGVCETDFSGYPDCRDDTIKALQVAVNLGMESRFVVHTPLMWLDKAETWSLAGSLGGERLTDLLLENTHTCYAGERTVRNEWGYGCGRCPACLLRSDGYHRWRATTAPEASEHED